MAATEREVLSPASQQRGGQSTGAATQNVGELDRWISAIGGGALATLGLMQKSVPSVALASLGGYLIYRGVSGYCAAYNALGINTATPSATSIAVERAVTINKPASELFQFWRNFENLPQFMDHLESVTIQNDTRSHWVVKAPAGTSVAWDADIVEEQENRFISWRSAPGADVENAGTVSFEELPNDRGTLVRVSLQYNPPAGPLGTIVARLFGEEPHQQVYDDLLHFKNLMETGEIPTTEGQPHGTRSILGKMLSPNN